MKKLLNDKALEVVNKHRITIHQEYQSPLDAITPFLLYSKEKALEELPKYINKPVLYFAVQENRNYYFINFLIYHPFDWSDRKLPFFMKPIKDWIDDLDSHQHDTESVCLRVHKKTSITDIVTVSHTSHVFNWGIKTLEIISDGQGHALTPMGKTELCDNKVYRTYRSNSYRLENIFEWDDQKTHLIKRGLKRSGRVNWIDEQFDGTLKLQTATGRFRSQDLQHLPGDIILNPAKLFKIGKKCGR